MEYFGTDTTTHGHYLWKLIEDQILGRNLNLKDLPFNPEEMPRREKEETRKKGDVEYYQEHGYSIIAIEGSCVDTRWGTKSVFFVKGELTQREMIGLIKSIPIANHIICQMPFEVKL